MKSKKFGVLLDGALATAVLAAAISATTWARPSEEAPPGSCCHTHPCASGGSNTQCNPDGGCISPLVCLGDGGSGTATGGCWAEAWCGPKPKP